MSKHKNIKSLVMQSVHAKLATSIKIESLQHELVALSKKL